jgi:hypothetical protein
MALPGYVYGLQDGRSSRLHDIFRVMRYLQTSQRRPPGYIVENVPVVNSSQSRTLENMHRIHNILGVPVLIDAAAVGSRAPRRVYHDDQAPLVVVNRKGEPRRALPTLVSFARSYAFKDNGPGLVSDSTTQEMVEPNADERKKAWAFPRVLLTSLASLSINDDSY